MKTIRRGGAAWWVGLPVSCICGSPVGRNRRLLGRVGRSVLLLPFCRVCVRSSISSSIALLLACLIVLQSLTISAFYRRFQRAKV